MCKHLKPGLNTSQTTFNVKLLNPNFGHPGVILEFGKLWCTETIFPKT